MKRQGTVSIIIPTYQRARLLDRCLRAFSAELKSDDEVVVVNDGSTDGTTAVAKQYPFVRLLEQGNQGTSAAVNNGISHVSGDYVWVFGDDDLPLPGALSRMRAWLDDNPDADFGVCTWRAATTPPGSEDLVPYGPTFTLPELSSRGQLLPLFELCFIGGASMFARRNVYQDLGGYDAKYKRAQDYHLAIRAALNYRYGIISTEPAFLYAQDPHTRGTSRDTYDPSLWQRRKWLNFDQQLYFELIHDLPLANFTEHGDTELSHLPLAHVNKARVAASKLLPVQTVDALLLRSSLFPEQYPDPIEELRLSSLLGLGAHYEVGTVERDRVFQTGLESLGQVSPAGSRIQQILSSSMRRRQRARRINRHRYAFDWLKSASSRLQ